MKKPGLLKTLNECEYPAEFLVTRLLGKKGTLFRNWEFLITSSDAVQSLKDTPFYPYLSKYAAPGIWRFLQHEHLWVYSRMNNTLRTQFESYFVYHEISTLIVCLRYLFCKKEIELVKHGLHNSLLHNDIQDILTSGFDFTAMLQVLELRLCANSEHFKGLRQCFDEKGITALEVFLRDCFFCTVFSRKQKYMLKVFFQFQVDFHNCMYLAKTLRWQTETEPAMIPGGTLPANMFKKSFFRKNMSVILRHLHLKDPEEAASALQKLETALLSFITGKLKTWSFQRSVVGDILFYLWEQYLYTRNISMVLNTILLDDEPVRERVVA